MGHHVRSISFVAVCIFTQYTSARRVAFLKLFLMLLDSLATAEEPSEEEDYDRPERVLKNAATIRMEGARPTYQLDAQEDGFLYVLGSTVARWLTAVVLKNQLVGYLLN